LNIEITYLKELTKIFAGEQKGAKEEKNYMMSRQNI
jgi:hypothetical protein